MVSRSAERSVAAGTRGGRGGRGDPRGLPRRSTHLRDVPGAAGRRAGPGWTQAVSREIAGFLRSSVTAAWRHGWQPAELASHAGRELAGAHASMAADMIVDEIRGYAAATVDDRWAAQVASLDARRLVGSDARYLGVWQERQGATGKEAVTTAIELLHLLQHLPVQERLGPLPGTAHAGSSPTSGDVDERILDKVRALLAKAESTEFPEEAEALSARAQELMAKYSIDQAVLADAATAGTAVAGQASAGPSWHVWPVGA
jgi:hypothetical protein